MIACHGSFHGRSFATLAAAGAEAYLKGFGPVMDGFDHVAFNNLNEMRAAVTDKTAAILVEPVQGEGGVRAPSEDYLKGLRAICDEFGLLLVYDEVQCGMGRTGKLFAHQWQGVPPDVMAVAKALGNGFPIGACLATEKAAVGMTGGSHGSTFGGNPLAVAAGNAVLDVMLAPGFFERTQTTARRLWSRLAALVAAHPGLFAELRGAGHLLGVRCQPSLTAGDFVAKLRGEGLLCLTAGENVLRILPPLVASEREIDEGLGDHRQGGAAMAGNVTAVAPGVRSGATLFGGRPGGSRPAGPPRHFLDIDRYDTGDLRDIIDLGFAYKNGRHDRPLEGKTLAMIFEKPSTRTRVSFEVAMRQLGGDAIIIGTADSQLGRGETIADTARVLSRYVDAIMIRTNHAAKLDDMARYASVPVINGLTDSSHPCQIMADVMTLQEKKGPVGDTVVAWSGDGNNVAVELDPRRGALRLRSASRLPAIPAAAGAGRRLGAPRGRAGRSGRRPGAGGCRRRLRCHRHLGVDGGRGERQPAQPAWPPTGSTSG